MNKETKNFNIQEIGQIIECSKKMVIRMSIGTASEDGADSEDTIDLSVGNSYNPILQYKDKFFILSWKDIVGIAAERGLFKSEVKE